MVDRANVNVGKAKKTMAQVTKDDWTKYSQKFPFKPYKGCTHIPSFQENLYVGKLQNPSLLSASFGKHEANLPGMLDVIGAKTLVPEDASEKCENYSSSQWRSGEVWRVLNVFNALLASDDNHPVAKLVQETASTPLGKKVFPDTVSERLCDNEAAIVGSGHDWIGRPTNGQDKQEKKNKAGDQKTGDHDKNKAGDKNKQGNIKQGNVKQGDKQIKEEPGKQGVSGVPSAQGVRLLHAHTGTEKVPKGVRYYQTGAAGPFSLEACFIFATQLAGINWSKVRARMTAEDYDSGVYWLTLQKPGANGGTLYEEWPSHKFRRLGRSIPVGEETHHPDVGLTVVLDLDPDLDEDTVGQEKKVFVFAIHLIDTHSRLKILDSNPETLCYAAYAPGTPGVPPCGKASTKDEPVYYHPHAHAAIMPYSTWMTFYNMETGGSFPLYQQISGSHHLYFWREDEEDVAWPRKKFDPHAVDTKPKPKEEPKTKPKTPSPPNRDHDKDEPKGSTTKPKTPLSKPVEEHKDDYKPPGSSKGNPASSGHVSKPGQKPVDKPSVSKDKPSGKPATQPQHGHTQPSMGNPYLPVGGPPSGQHQQGGHKPPSPGGNPFSQPQHPTQPSGGHTQGGAKPPSQQPQGGNGGTKKPQPQAPKK